MFFWQAFLFNFWSACLLKDNLALSIANSCLQNNLIMSAREPVERLITRFILPFPSLSVPSLMLSWTRRHCLSMINSHCLLKVIDTTNPIPLLSSPWQPHLRCCPLPFITNNLESLSMCVRVLASGRNASQTSLFVYAPGIGNTVANIHNLTLRKQVKMHYTQACAVLMQGLLLCVKLWIFTGFSGEFGVFSWALTCQARGRPLRGKCTERL